MDLMKRVKETIKERKGKNRGRLDEKTGRGEQSTDKVRRADEGQRNYKRKKGKERREEEE